jgi:uncharacterized membrane protein YbaN (DUF454 family)
VRAGSKKNQATPHEDQDAAVPDVLFDTKERTIRVRDRRIINPGQRAFCRRLLEAAARRARIRKAEIDLTEACCRIEFAGRTASSQTMADFFAECVQEATRGSKEAVGSPATATQEDWLKMTAFPLENDVSLWETMGSEPNRIKLRHHCANDERDVPRMAEAISRLDDVKRCQASLHSRSLTVDFRHSLKELNGFMDQAELSFEQLLAEGSKRHEADIHGSALERAGDTFVVSGPKRLLYLALAGGMFLLTLVGLVIPGIPTVPFLLATSYFLARSSRWLDEKLRESVFFGSIVTEWERHRALSWESKAKLLGLSGAIVLAALLLSPLSPLLIVAILVVSSLSGYGVYRMPGLEGEARGANLDASPRLALPAP